MNNEVRVTQLGSVGILELNRPQALNALSYDMLFQIRKALRAWERDDSVEVIFLHSSSTKAFCAGGDVRNLALALQQDPTSGTGQARSYFLHEYQTDYAIHRFPKPLVCWGESWILGGGWGLFAGASHRVVTESTQLSMPETAIGFFPDVAASWFFRGLPKDLALFLAVTGARVTAEEALNWELADYLLPATCKGQVIDSLSGLRPTGDLSLASERVHRCLSDLSHTGVEPKDYNADFIKLARKINFRDPQESLELLKEWKPQNPNWRKATEGLATHSPYAALLTHELFARLDEVSDLKEAFNRDLQVAQFLCEKDDFREGVIAKLVEKRPAHWTEPAVDEVDFSQELRKAYDPEKKLFSLD